MITLALVPLFGLVGLVTDIGYGHFISESAETAAQSAASAAALAAVATGSQITCTTTGIACHATPAACNNPPTNPPANNIDNGCLYAQQHDFTATGRQNVTMQSGIGPGVPAAPGIASAQYWVTVRVSERIPQLFSALLGNLNLNVTKRASAAIVGIGGGCIYVLEPTGANAFVVSGSGSVTAPCGIYVESSDPKAMQVSGGGCVTATGSVIDLVGNDTGSNSCISPAATTAVPSFPDPLALLSTIRPAAPVSPIRHALRGAEAITVLTNPSY